MMIFPFSSWQLVLSNLLYLSLFIQAYLLFKFVKKHSLLHHDVAGKIKTLSYIFTVLLIVKLTFGIVAIKSIDLQKVARQAKATELANGYSAGYSSGYYTGVYTGHFLKALVTITGQNIDLIFAIAFIWLLSYVFKEALRLKQEQELTI